MWACPARRTSALGGRQGASLIPCNRLGGGTPGVLANHWQGVSRHAVNPGRPAERAHFGGHARVCRHALKGIKPGRGLRRMHRAQLGQWNFGLGWAAKGNTAWRRRRNPEQPPGTCQPARRRRPGVRESTAAGGGKGLKLACTHEPGTPGGSPSLDRPICRAPALILPTSPQLGSGTKASRKQARGKKVNPPGARAERDHNWMRGTRIGEASNPGPAPGQERSKGVPPGPSCRFGGRCKFAYCPFSHPRQWTKTQSQPEDRNQGGPHYQTPRRPCWYGQGCRHQHCPFYHEGSKLKGVSKNWKLQNMGQNRAPTSIFQGKTTQKVACWFGAQCKYFFCPFVHPRSRTREPHLKTSGKEIQPWGGRGRPEGRTQVGTAAGARAVASRGQKNYLGKGRVDPGVRGDTPMKPGKSEPVTPGLPWGRGGFGQPAVTLSTTLPFPGSFSGRGKGQPSRGGTGPGKGPGGQRKGGERGRWTNF